MLNMPPFIYIFSLALGQSPWQLYAWSQSTPCANAHCIRVDLAQPSGGGAPTDSGLLSQSLPDPAILPVICTDDDDEIVARRVKRMEEVGDDAKQSETSGKNDELILDIELLVEILLILLLPFSNPYITKNLQALLGVGKV